MNVMFGNKRTIRSPKNPMDVATIVSMYPRDIRETKETIIPGTFVIPKGSYDKPTVVPVRTSSWFKEMEAGQPDFEVTCSSVEIADSLVKDYCGGLFKVTMPDIMPALFWVPGEYTLPQLMLHEQHKQKFLIAKIRQIEWYRELVTEADRLWAQHNGNPRVIWEMMKVAAEELELRDKPWMKDVESYRLVNCPACGAPRKEDFPICATCGTIVNKELYTKLGLEKKN